MNILRKNDYEKLIISCWVMLIALWIYVGVSGNYLTIVVDNPNVLEICKVIDDNWVMNKACRFLMYYLNWIFVVYAIFQKRLFRYKPILISIIIFIFWFIKNYFEHISLVNYIDLFVFIILAILCKRKWYRSIIACILTFIFAIISSFIKSVFIPNVNFDTLPIIIALVFSIDIYLMTVIYYLIIMYRKEKDYGKLFNLVQIKQKVENYFSSIGNSISDFFRRNRSIASIRSKTYELYCGLIFTILTYLSLLIVGLIFDRWIELTVSAVFFHIFRGKDEETYHAKNDLQCWCVSMFNFIVIMRLTLPIYISYIVSIGLSFALCLIMRLVYLLLNLINKFKITKQKDKRHTIIEILGKDNLDEESIEKVCSQHGLTTKYSETVYLYINNTLEETAELLGVDCRTISRRLNSFIEKCSKF